MGLQFEGAIDNISEPQLAFIRGVLEQRGYKDTKVTFEVVGEASDNYVANVKRIVVSNEDGEFRMIAKISPQNEMVRTTMGMENLFMNEHIMYTMVLPKFQELEQQADLPKQDRLRFAECYGSLSTPPHEVILLEDLVVPGFRMLDRFQPLSDDCVKSVLKDFALLHSLSYVLKHKEPETFNKYRNQLYDMWGNMVEIPFMSVYFDHLETTAATMISGDEKKRRLKGCIVEGLSLSAKLAKQGAGSRYSVIQQGDSWTNNILFRFEENSLRESVLIDYQASKVTNPTCDLLYMIFNCTDHASRLENFNDWMDYYHSELDKALSHHGLKANFVYPRDKLDTDLRRYARTMFGISMFLAGGIIVKAEDAEKRKAMLEKPIDQDIIAEVNQFDEETACVFKERIEGLLDSFIQLGLF